MPSVKGVMRRITRAVRFGRFDRRNVFVHIFDSRYWGESESVSGLGSSLTQTEQIRTKLPELLRRLGVRTLFDAPCGDLYWMKTILADAEFHYIGGDIVPAVVDMARRSAPNASCEFRVFDITSDPFPEADLWLCRDVLFHLSFANIKLALANFCRSEIEWLLVTTHTNPGIVNRNIVTGEFRHLDMFKAPFAWPKSLVVERFEDSTPPAARRDLVLIRRTALAEFLKTRR